jgi:DNA-directed RNA polymerase specialized sigma24 family protein
MVRHPIKLAFFEGIPHAEIAAAVEPSLGTSKGRLHRGFVLIRDGLEKRAGSRVNTGTARP